MTITDYYVATDAMGSVTAILDDEGNVIERRSYDAFGEMTCMTPDGTPVAESPTSVDVGFQGQISDKVTGLYQMGYRWYNPVLGRWLSPDPIKLVGGSNLMKSFNNNPCSDDDYSGLSVSRQFTEDNGVTLVRGRINYTVFKNDKCADVDAANFTYTYTDRFAKQFLEAISFGATAFGQNIAIKAYKLESRDIIVKDITKKLESCTDCKVKMVKTYKLEMKGLEQLAIFEFSFLHYSQVDRHSSVIKHVTVESECLPKCQI